MKLAKQQPVFVERGGSKSLSFGISNVILAGMGEDHGLGPRLCAPGRRRLTFNSTDQGTTDLFAIPADNSGAARRITVL